MIFDLHPCYLSWDEVDPARHPFDPSLAAQVVSSLGPARRVPHRPEGAAADPLVIHWSHDEGALWASAMSYALVQHYGQWAAGWRWALAEGDFDGGPIGNWCCPRDSITTPDETLARVAAALCEWRGWLESIAGWFDRYPLDLATVDEQRILWERACRNLIFQVADRTGGDSGWYGHCRQVLTWFLSRWHVAPDVAQVLVDRAIGGRFHSWASPDTVLVDDIAEQLALSLRPDDGQRPARPAPDHLERWLAMRQSVPWPKAPAPGANPPVVPARDSVAADFRSFDGAIDPARAAGLLAALEQVRSDAARGAFLDFALLSSWQQHVLGTPQVPEFRSVPAFAKGGRERYGIGPDTCARFDACLAESSNDRFLSLTARAARAYLDVCFFHPFDDGNARAAFFTLIFVLASEGVTPGRVGLLRRVSFQADDAEDPLILTRYIDICLSENRRDAPSPDRKPS